jgi:hypothetical protein
VRPNIMDTYAGVNPRGPSHNPCALFQVAEFAPLPTELNSVTVTSMALDYCLPEVCLATFRSCDRTFVVRSSLASDIDVSDPFGAASLKLHGARSLTNTRPLRYRTNCDRSRCGQLNGHTGNLRVTVSTCKRSIMLLQDYLLFQMQRPWHGDARSMPPGGL